MCINCMNFDYHPIWQDDLLSLSNRFSLLYLNKYYCKKAVIRHLLPVNLERHRIRFFIQMKLSIFINTPKLYV